MSTYVTNDGYRFIVSEENLEGAREALGDEYFYEIKDVETAAKPVGDGVFLLEPSYPPFDGNWGWGVEEIVAEFISEWCEPCSYVSLRFDDEFSFSIIGKDEKGEMFSDSLYADNPFYQMMCDLDKKSGIEEE